VVSKDNKRENPHVFSYNVQARKCQCPNNFNKLHQGTSRIYEILIFSEWKDSNTIKLPKTT